MVVRHRKSALALGYSHIIAMKKTKNQDVSWSLQSSMGWITSKQPHLDQMMVLHLYYVVVSNMFYFHPLGGTDPTIPHHLHSCLPSGAAPNLDLAKLVHPQAGQVGVPMDSPKQCWKYLSQLPKKGDRENPVFFFFALKDMFFFEMIFFRGVLACRTCG